MNWIIISVLAGIFYAFMILGITYLTKIKRLSVISVNFQYLPIIFFFLIPIIFLLEGGIVIPGLKTLTILITAGGLSFLGNLTLVKAIKTAPNPGYANAIASSRILIAMLGSVLLIGAKFDILSAIGVILIFLGIGLLQKIKNITRDFNGSSWKKMSLLSAVSLGLMIILVSYSVKLVSSLTVNFYVIGIISLLFFLLALKRKEKIVTSRTTAVILIMTAIFGLLGNVLLFHAYSITPNPGYANAISSIRMIGALFLSYLILRRKVELEITGVVGVLMIFTGIIVLSL